VQIKDPLAALPDEEKESLSPKQTTPLRFLPSNEISLIEPVINGSVEEPILIESLKATPCQDPLTSHKKPHAVFTIEDTPENNNHLSRLEEEQQHPIKCNLLERQEEGDLGNSNETAMEQEAEILEEFKIPQGKLTVDKEPISDEKVENELLVESLNSGSVNMNTEDQREPESEETVVDALIENDKDNEGEALEEGQQNNTDIVNEIPEGEAPLEKMQLEENQYEVIENVEPSNIIEENVTQEVIIPKEVEEVENAQIEEEELPITKIDEEVENQQEEVQVQQVQVQEEYYLPVQDETALDQGNDSQQKQSQIEEEIENLDSKEIVLENEPQQLQEQVEVDSLKEVPEQTEEASPKDQEDPEPNSDADNLLAYQQPIASLCDNKNEEINNSNLLSQLDDNSLFQVDVSFTEELEKVQDMRILDSETKKGLALEQDNAEEESQILKDFRSPKKSIGANAKFLVEREKEQNQNLQQEEPEKSKFHALEPQIEERPNEMSLLATPVESILEEPNIPLNQEQAGTQEEKSMLIENDNDIPQNLGASERLSQLRVCSILENEDLLTDTSCLKFNSKIYSDESAEKNPKDNVEINESAMQIEKEEKKETETYIVGRQIKPPTYLERYLFINFLFCLFT